MGIDTYSATIIDDPILKPQSGDTLSFSDATLGFNNLEPDKTAWRQQLKSLEGVALAISISLPGEKMEDKIIGSAVMIAPGVAVCAQHIFDPLDQRAKVTAAAFGQFGTQLWSIRSIQPFGSGDLAILLCSLSSELPPDLNFRLARMSVMELRADDEITIAGFRAVPVTENGVEIAGLSLIFSHGLVTNVYPQGRDRVMLPGPVAEVKSISFGGMSGGPAFDKRGRLVGVLSSSYDDNANGPSYISLISPILSHPIDRTWPPSPMLANMTLDDLSNQNVCFVDRP